MSPQVPEFVSPRVCSPQTLLVHCSSIMTPSNLVMAYGSTPYHIAGKFGGLAIGVSAAKFNSHQILHSPKFCWVSFLTVEQTWSEVWMCKDNCTCKYISQDGPTLQRKITCDRVIRPNPKGLEKAQMLKSSVALNASPQSHRKLVRKANTMTTRLSKEHAWIGKHLTPITVQRILPAVWRNNKQAANIFPCPTTIFPLRLHKLLTVWFGSFQPFTVSKVRDVIPSFLSALASNNAFIIKMWPGGTPHGRTLR